MIRESCKDDASEVESAARGIYRWKETCIVPTGLRSDRVRAQFPTLKRGAKFQRAYGARPSIR